MTKYNFYQQLYVLLFLLVFFTSCNGQVKTDVPKNNAIERNATAIGQQKMMKNHFTNPNQAAADNVHCGLQDKAGNLWFGTTGDGVYRYDGTLFTNFTMKDGLNSNTVWSILEDKTGHIWIGTDAGVCRFDGKTITKIPISLANENTGYANFSPNNPAAKNDVWSMLQDKNGIIWFGTTEGVYCYDGKSFTRFLDDNRIENKKKLTLKSVQCMLQDKNGNLWFGSGPMAFEGICLYDGKSITNFKPKNEGWIRNLLEDKNGKIWTANRHNGLCVYDGKSFNHFAEKEVFNETGTGAIVEDKDGNIWFSSLGKEEDGGIWRFDGKTFKNWTVKDGLTNPSVFFMMTDKADNLWIGTRNTGLYRYDGKTFTAFSDR
jgi:ligand-binding sensor domain-containing protein